MPLDRQIVDLGAMLTAQIFQNIPFFFVPEYLEVLLGGRRIAYLCGAACLTAGCLLFVCHVDNSSVLC